MYGVYECMSVCVCVLVRMHAPFAKWQALMRQNCGASHFRFINVLFLSFCPVRLAYVFCTGTHFLHLFLSYNITAK